MKVRAKAGVLARLLQIVARAAPGKRPAVPLLSAVLVEAKEGVLSMSVTDGEISMTLGARAPVEEEGRAAVPARVLLDILKSLPDEEVLLSANGSAATVLRGKDAYEIVAHPNPDEFPSRPAFPGTSPQSQGKAARLFSVPADRFARAVGRVAPCASPDEKRPVLTGVFFSFADAAATMVATDGFRLALDRVPLLGGPGGTTGGITGGAPSVSGTALVPGRALKEAARLSELGEEMAVALTKNHAIFSVRGVVLSSRLIEGAYPDYRKLLPGSSDREFGVEANALRDALGRASLMAGRQEPPAAVRLAFARTGEAGTIAGTGELTVSVRGARAGRATETVPAEVPEGGAFESCYNPQVLLDGVRAVAGEKVRFLANGPLEQVLMGGTEERPEPAGGDPENGAAPGGFLYMAMPVRDPGARENVADKAGPGAAAGNGAGDQTAAAGD